MAQDDSTTDMIGPYTTTPAPSEPLNQDALDEAIQDLKAWFSNLLSQVDRGETAVKCISADDPMPKWEDIE